MQPKFLPLLITSLILFHATNSVISESVGDTCIDTKGVNGICNFIHYCPQIIHLRYSGAKYYSCGFQDEIEIVCCAQRNIEKEKPKPQVGTKKHARECEQYKSKLFDIDLVFTSLTASASPTKRTTSKCSQYTFPLVVGGENANPKEFAHMALLGCKNENGNYSWTCGGALISTNYVLTAAHCFEASTECNEITVVRLGELDTTSETEDAQPKDFNITSVITHPQYNSSVKYNDIALIKLETNVEMSLYIRPACLPSKNYNNDKQLIITGWGATEFARPNAAHLKKATVEQFGQSECNQIQDEEENTNLPVEEKERTQICAGSKNSNKDTCSGDSGGPLQTIHPDYPCMYSIVGVTSYGQSCGIAGIPGIYTRVFNYNDWIESIVWN